MNNLDGWKRSKTRVLAGITAVSLLLIGVLFVRDLAVFSQGTNELATPLDSGGGEYDPGPLDHITDTQRQEIGEMLDENMKVLAENGRLPTPNLTTQVFFAWPLKLKDGHTDPGYHGISGFVDHDPAYPNQLEDYLCRDRTYDTSAGYNHKGTDFFLWPFSWNKMDADEVEIIAAAPGTIIAKRDGHDDKSCSFNGKSWNAVYILHADGSVAWYGHMKRNSLTTKLVGQTVVTGEYLGIVGSSGNSTGPHLHFEVYRSASYQATNLIDPYAGSCNSFNGPTSWWVEQRPYYDSAVNKLTTGSAAPYFPSCPNPTVTNVRTLFAPGSDIYLTAYYRDQLNSQDSVNTIYQPDGTVFSTWIVNSNADDGHYSASYWWRSYKLPPTAPEGMWRYEVVFEEETYHHEFEVKAEHNYLPVVLKDEPATPTPTHTSTPTPTFTPTLTFTPTPTSTPTVTPTATFEATALPTVIAEP